MLKFIIASLVGTVSGMSAAQAQVVGGRVICESKINDYVECETGVSVANPAVAQQYSTEACTFGSTWGFYDSKIWVGHGCRAQFSYDVASGPTPAPAPAPVPAPRPPVSQVVDCRWNSMNWQPFYKPTQHFVGLAGFGFRDANTCVYSVQRAHSYAVCNWTGGGFTAYDAETNAEVNSISYGTIDACYASVL